MDGQYKVSVYSSKLGIPLNLVVHTHIVTQYNDTVNRYDVFAPFTIPKHKQSSTGNIFKNFFSPKTGFLKIFRQHQWWDEDSPHARWNVVEHSSIQGSVGSSAEKLYHFIESKELLQYPGIHHYRFILGPNSNSFTQWVIDQVPECKLSLPWNAWGKGYKAR